MIQPKSTLRRWLMVTALLTVLAACGGGATISQSTGTDNDVAPSPQSDAGATQAITAATSGQEDRQPSPLAEREPAREPESAPTALPATPPAAVAVSVPEPAAVRNYTVADITDLILVTGQSNALGADTDYDESLDRPDKQVFAFTDQGWLVADLHQVWDLDWFPRGNPGEAPNNNFALHFGKQVAKRSADMIVGVILVTAPGTAIEHWSQGGEFYSHLQHKVVSAINQTPHKSGVDGILWHQGESNAGDTNYGEKLDALIAGFRSENWFDSNRPFICGETAEFEVVNRQLMALNSNGDPWSACVRSSSLRTRSDGYHFSAAGLRELGRRYAEKYIEMRWR